MNSKCNVFIIHQCHTVRQALHIWQGFNSYKGKEFNINQTGNSFLITKEENQRQTLEIPGVVNHQLIINLTTTLISSPLSLPQNRTIKISHHSLTRDLYFLSRSLKTTVLL